MKEQVKAWLEEGKVDLFLGCRMVDGHPLPHVFDKRNLPELDGLVLSPARYPLEKMAADMLLENPELRIGIAARDCNHRTLNVLVVSNQLGPDRIKTLEVSCCPSKSGERADCSSLRPEPCGAFKRWTGVDRNASLAEIEAAQPKERFDKWMYEFQKCIKCYGCRNICPVCFCRECSLENPDLVQTGPLPPEVPLFHLLRAVHMAGRCVDCGLCEEACPMDIPLRLLYRKVNRIVKDLFDYDTGVSQGPPPLTVCEAAERQARPAGRTA